MKRIMTPAWFTLPATRQRPGAHRAQHDARSGADTRPVNAPRSHANGEEHRRGPVVGGTLGRNALDGERMPRLRQRALQRRAVSGFTLIEIMVVVVILGILAAIAIPNILDNPEEARLTKARSDLRTIENALEMYKLDNFRFPTTEQGLEALVSEPTAPPEAPNYQAGGYLRSLPKDPWGNAYQYLGPQDSEGARPRILTLGADGRTGGEGADQDISNLDVAE